MYTRVYYTAYFLNVNKLSDQAGNINTCLCPVARYLWNSYDSALKVLNFPW